MVRNKGVDLEETYILGFPLCILIEQLIPYLILNTFISFTTSGTVNESVHIAKPYVDQYLAIGHT